MVAGDGPKPLPAGSGALPAMAGLKGHVDEIVKKSTFGGAEKKKPKSPVTPTSVPHTAVQKGLLDADKAKTKKELRDILDRVPVTPRTKTQLLKQRAEYLEKIAVWKANYPHLLDNEDVHPWEYKLKLSPELNTFPEHPEAYGTEITAPIRHERKIRYRMNKKLLVKPNQMTSVTLEDHTEEKVKEVGTWSIKQLHFREHIIPGTVIRTQHAVANNDLNTSYPNDHVRMFAEGPVFAKWRPMIVLWTFEDHLVCVPLFSFAAKNGAGKREIGWKLEQLENQQERLKELIPVKSDDAAAEEWRGYKRALDNGPPLIMKLHPKDYKLGVGCFADLARTVSISRWDHYEDDLAKLTDGSFARLLEIFRYRQLKARKMALQSHGFEDASQPLLSLDLHRMSHDRERWRRLNVSDEQMDEDDSYYDAEFMAKHGGLPVDAAP